MADAQHDREKHLLTRVGDRRVAVRLGDVRRVVRDLPVYPVPGGASHLVGVGSWGGEPVAVVDVGTLVSADRETRLGAETVVIVRVPSGGAVALAVDEVVGLVSPVPDEDAPGGRSRDGRLSTDDGEQVPVLDTGSIGGGAR